MIHLIKDFFRRCGTIVAYIPVLWDDHDWDYGYILKLMEKKLDRVYAELSSPKRTCGFHTKKELRRLQTTRCLCKRLVEQDYWALANGKDRHITFDLWDTVGQDRLERTKKLNDAHRMVQKTNMLEQQDWKLFWKHMSKYCLRWWD